MYEKYLLKLEEAGKIRNLKERSITCYRNYVSYFLNYVGKIPEELNSVILSNQKLLYDALYHASSATIDELSSDSKHLGAKVGYISILHTWGSEMNFHPHIHMILLGGGLTVRNEWKDNGPDFFFQYRLSQKFLKVSIWKN